MKYIYRVARREFAENAATKGFWIGIFLFPVMILVSIEAQGLLQKAEPTRHFVLIDQSGKFEKALDDGIELENRAAALREAQKYIRQNARTDAVADQAPDMSDVLDTPLSVLEQLKEFEEDSSRLLALAPNGLEQMLEKARPMLKEDAPPFEAPKRRFERISLPEGIDPSAPLDDIAEALRPYLRDDETVDGTKLFAAILIPADAEEHIVRPMMGMRMPDAMPGAGTAEGERRGAQYWSSNLAASDLREVAERVVNEQVREWEYAGRDLDPEAVDAVQKTRLPFGELNPKKAVGKEEVSTADKIRQYAPVAFVYLLWIGIFTISQMLLNNTIEEKSNRIIEVLLSSVTAGELMMGKLFGIAAVGITMLLAWFASLMVILEFKAGPEAELVNQILEVLKSSGLLPAFAVYFLLGYFMYAGLFLTIGSVCNTLKEAQNLMGPVMLIMFVPLITMMFIPKDPNGTLATVLSWIPLYTPFVMMNRAAADPPMFDIVGTGILLVLSTATVLWMTGKIFRAGILRTGQPPKLLEMFRWIRSS